MTSSGTQRPWWLLSPARVSPVWWILLAVAGLLTEYMTGSYQQFPVLYFLPVALSAWYSGRWPAVALAIIVPCVHFVFEIADGQPRSLATLIPMTIFRGFVITMMALWFARLSEHERALEHEVETLQGLLPICTFCKSIKNDAGEWEHLERYISRRSATQFSHGLCPPCQQEHYGQLAEREST